MGVVLLLHAYITQDMVVGTARTMELGTENAYVAHDAVISGEMNMPETLQVLPSKWSGLPSSVVTRTTSVRSRCSERDPEGRVGGSKLNCSAKPSQHESFVVTSVRIEVTAPHGK